ncbi:hypothetical protein K3495_g9643 [Podosphaera aphanis]|nr:hypothetical protein K3495_g9643 [Podosphaera aphanis]
MPINQPSNKIKHTNVSLVRLKKAKKRFEIACYKNKVLEWRSGNEKDLDNVLQINSVFLNVSKGQTASSADLQKSFGPEKSVNDIILEILNNGELQVGEKERQAQLERAHNEVISLVASRLVDPKTKRVYTTGMIAKALEMLSSQKVQTLEDKCATVTTKDAKAKVKEHTWTGVVATRSPKSQALEAIKALIAHQPIPVARARMRLRITCPVSIVKQKSKLVNAKGEEEGTSKSSIKELFLSYFEEVGSEEIIDSDWEVTGFAEPGVLKGLEEVIGNETKGLGRLEVLDTAISSEE